MSFYEYMERALTEAIEIENGNVPLTERKNVLAKTYYVADNDKDLIDKILDGFSTKGKRLGNHWF